MKEWNTKSEVQKQIKEKPNQKKERRKDGWLVKEDKFFKIQASWTYHLLGAWCRNLKPLKAEKNNLNLSTYKKKER
jgi:hypothetical protein